MAPADRLRGSGPGGAALASLVCYLIVVLLTAAGRLHSEARPSAASQAPRQEAVQTECPVMVGSKIDKTIFTVYRGKKVYFCCPTCKSAFEKAPQKYLSRLPQFSVAGEGGRHEGREKGGDPEHAAGCFFTAGLIKPMGIATLALVACTVTLGVLRRLKPRLLLKIHKICGVCALAAGAAHAALVLCVH